jgi:hypothetical protein
MSSMKRVRHSAEQMYGLIEEWQQSAQGKAEFCKASGIAVCVFDYWRRKQGLENIKVEQCRGFTEVKPPSALSVKGDCQLRLHYPDGRVLEFVATPSVSFLREILTW